LLEINDEIACITDNTADKKTDACINHDDFGSLFHDNDTKQRRFI
jgi:hypothetical protein